MQTKTGLKAGTVVKRWGMVPVKTTATGVTCAGEAGLGAAEAGLNAMQDFATQTASHVAGAAMGK
nr:hypothetical protein 2 [bacterium]